MVTPSRTEQFSPNRQKLGPPSYYAILGKIANDPGLLRMNLAAGVDAPRVWPRMMAAAPITANSSGPIRTGPSITAYGPTVAVGSIVAKESIIAVGWTLIGLRFAT